MTTPDSDSLLQPGRLQRPGKGHIGLIVAASLATGLVVAVVLVVAPFVEAKENVLTGMVLLAFALGWALLAVLSIRFSDQPQRWATAPAVFFALAGLISLLGSDTLRHVFGWVWPPVLLGLVVWMIIGPASSCTAEPGGGCCIRCSLCWLWPRWVEAMKR